MDIVKIYPQVEVAQISSYENNKIFNLCKCMYLGKKNTNNVYRILFKFPVSSIPDQCLILKATLKLYVQYAGTLMSSSFTPYALSQPWNLQTVTWNNQPSFYSTLSGETKLIKRVGFHSFNITEMVTKWYRHEIINYGLIIKNNELLDKSYKQINTVTNSNLAPTAEIIYTSKSEVSIASTRFVSSIEEINTDGPYSFSSTINMSLTKTVTCHIKNLGNFPVEVKYQMSPNGIDFVDDCPETRIIPGNGMIWFVPYSFAKYGRIAARNVDPTKTSRIRIWYEAQE
ncbi:DNRLRE domain-containing protein [Crassaminicella thermophila]|uniref:DNRLRE domain-containing protein n=1 Tax=Crassaminicella thermophila TaxID=2599308 RepID=A0A5C0SFD1_CRATE|nr:DNRLRE domain-containing protein [Crassaminicella thermophila]QEK12486.1 DNRLRE domain-containing protein [Crassaminicella thermophila]